MEDIYQYILRPKTERQEHLDLDERCIERGGTSTYSKALLAEHTSTTIPSGHRIHVCHACNNGRCSNVRHLYWGTASENRRDRVRYENRMYTDILEDRYRRGLPTSDYSEPG